jgi:hypothetical protein
MTDPLQNQLATAELDTTARLRRNQTVAHPR